MITLQSPQPISLAQMILALGLLFAGVPCAAAGSDTSKGWNFDTVSPGTLPDGFKLGRLYDGRPAGDWQVIETTDAVSAPHVLAQLSDKGAEHAYKMFLIDGTESSNVDLSVSFRAVGGKGDMGGGLIWRAVDDRNYYLTRANPLEQNIRLYRVDKGVRKMIANQDQIIDVRKWHRLRVLMHGCHIQVFYDDAHVFDQCDQSLTVGKIGLWTKSDAVSYFDDLQLVIQK
ncbi:hypothetical protein [Nitrospira sp. Nam74]